MDPSIFFVFPVLFLIAYQIYQIRNMSLNRIYRKSSKLTEQEKSEIREEMLVGLQDAENTREPLRIPKKYWDELMDEYLKFCINPDDFKEDDIIIILDKCKGHFNKGVLQQMYYILAMNYVKGKLHRKYIEQWDKEKELHENS